jgi:hypothetical protein
MAVMHWAIQRVHIVALSIPPRCAPNIVRILCHGNLIMLAQLMCLLYSSHMIDWAKLGFINLYQVLTIAKTYN